VGFDQVHGELRLAARDAGDVFIEAVREQQELDDAVADLTGAVNAADRLLADGGCPIGFNDDDVAAGL
jgi:hypothetical protein